MWYFNKMHLQKLHNYRTFVLTPLGYVYCFALVLQADKTLEIVNFV